MSDLPVEQTSIKILEDAKQIIAVLKNRLQTDGSLSSDYVEDVLELAKILWSRS